MRNKLGQFTKGKRTGEIAGMKGKRAWNKGISSGFALHPENINKTPWNKGKRGVQVAWNKGKLGPKGKDAHNWRGGTSTSYQLIRGSKEYKLWRKAVFERDNYTCIWCGKRGYLNADHIKPFSLYPELRFAIDNGRTLCRDCHKSTDTFAHKIYNYEKNSN